MKPYNIFLAFLIMAFLSGCATLTRDIRVETESAPGIDFAAYKTYGWLLSAEVVNDPHGNWEPPGFDADTELRFLINRELRARGLQEATRPDLFIAFAAGINMEVFEISSKPESEMYTIKNAPKGALVVVMIDPATRNPVWAGSAVGDVKAGRTSDEVSKRLAYAVKTMFNKFR
jgi:hypothetical protein